ncbi:oxygenase MpaB family protein [Streptomyces omiyaensis]|uniref:Oxygenase MpaB family protein n=1 Tax=Streptomyces omiyaensis TaxID=68247 RepID=A0ABW7C2E3_9ACTN|nr:oxygenase MpaB family protein [Streptomyces omiyaensis]GGY76980.1 histidine kinase [Streptomyces omiyaensis]
MRPTLIGTVRERAGEALLRRVAGPSADRKRARIHGSPGPRWFAPDRPVRVVHGDASMYVGGLAALLLQSLHPVAMSAVWAHSGFRGDPWGRLQRTSTFLAETTFGTADDAERAVERVRAAHARVSGTTSDGVAYRASDPALLSWVHLAETACFLEAHRRYGRTPLPDDRRDGYVADMASVARRLGIPDPPVTEAGLAGALERRRGEAAVTAESAGTARYLLAAPPLPWPARLPYALLAAAAVDLLPPWARRLVVLPAHVRLLLPVARPGGRLVIAAIRWVTPPPPVRPGPSGG